MQQSTMQVATLGLAVFALLLNAWTTFRHWQRHQQDICPRECAPEFCLEPRKSSADQLVFESFGGRRRYLGDQQKEWNVACVCDRNSGCPWIQAANQLAFRLGTAVDRHLLYAVTPRRDCADGFDAYGHPAGVYHLTPKARLVGPLRFVEAARQAKPPARTAVVGPGIENAQAGAEHCNPKG